MRQRNAADQAQQAVRKVREQEDAHRQAYDRYRRSAAADIFAALPKSEQGIINGLAQTHAAKFDGSLQDSMADFGQIRFTIERYGEKLITFVANGSPATWPEKTVGFDRSGCGF